MAIIKSRTEAIALYNEARALEQLDSTALLSYTPEERVLLTQQIIDLFTLAANTCPHENEERRAELDVDGVETYECMDCHNLSYIQN